MRAVPDDEEEPAEAASAGNPRLQLLPAANRAPLTVSREHSLRKAETLMLLNDYSQLPVMTGAHTIHGIISWKSIGRAHVVGSAGKQVADCMDTEFRVLAGELSLLRAVGEVIRHEIVLVQDKQKRIVGLVTTADLSMQLRDLADAFLLVGNIERQIRRLIGDRFSIDVLRSFVTSDTNRIVKSVEDLSFGEYLRLLNVPENWSRLGLKVDQVVVLKCLEGVRTIRNAVMHFRADALNGMDLDGLRATEGFLASLSAA